MLVLSRKVSQQIVIGEGITLTILRVDGNRVRLGIDAPTKVVIRRGELPRFDADDGTPVASAESPLLPR